MSETTKLEAAIADLLWDYLKRDPEHKDRRMTGFGTKTKKGLALSVARIVRECDEDETQSVEFARLIAKQALLMRPGRKR